MMEISEQKGGSVDWKDEFGRPKWDLYFLGMALLVSQRSIDQHTKCGCVFVSQNKSVLTVGYNGPPANCKDDLVPLTRPEKYPLMIHAEMNAILNAAKTGVALSGSTCYVTGHPCKTCFLHLLNLDLDRIVIGYNWAHMSSVGDNNDVIQKLIEVQIDPVPIDQYPYPEDVVSFMNKTTSYYIDKLESEGKDG